MDPGGLLRVGRVRRVGHAADHQQQGQRADERGDDQIATLHAWQVLQKHVSIHGRILWV